MSLVDTFYAANFTLNRLAVIIRIECWRFVVYLQEKFVSVRFVFFVCVIAKIERNIFGIFYFFVQHKNTVQVRSSIIHVMLLETFYLHSLEEGNKFEIVGPLKIIPSRFISLSRNVYIRVDTGCFSRRRKSQKPLRSPNTPRGDNFTFACTITRRATMNLANTIPF